MAAALGPTLPALAENTGTQLGEIGFLFTAHSLGYLLGSFQGGRFYDRVPGHQVMAAALMLMTLMLALTPLITWLWALAGAWLVLGLAAGALDVGGNTLLVWVHGRRVGPFMNALHFFFGVGAFLSPVIVAQVLSGSGEITWAYWILALLVLPGLLWLLRLPSPRAASNSEPGASDGSHFALIFLVATLLCLYVGAEVSFGGWVFSYALALDLSSEAAAAYLTSGFWGALTVGRLLTIPLAARLRPRTLLASSLAGCLASVGIVLAWPGSLAALWLGTLGTGLSMASIFPSSFSLAERHMPITGRVSGWFLVGSSLGGMALPWLIGQLFERIGPRVTMLAIVIDIVVAVGVFAVLVATLPRVRGRSGLEADQGR
jgi:FHS family Na+ dependent glucose MFS transporter 1